MRIAGLLAAGAALALAACQSSKDSGYVEIRTVPVNTSASQPPLYLDNVRLDPIQKGMAVLQKRVGTLQLATEWGGGQLSTLCEVVVRKNRVTTVMVSVIERPPRCQCRNGPKGTRTCVS